MRITINGQLKDLSAAGNLRAIVDQFSGRNMHVIAELNGNVVNRSSWEQTAVREGDSVELVNLVGGG